jgi:calcium-dependent protein kinase
MQEAFKSIDTDNSGTLSREELIEGYCRLFGEEVEDIEAEVDRIMSEVDTDHSGEIDYTEFVIATMN